jgi:rhamnose transport system permease protein
MSRPSAAVAGSAAFAGGLLRLRFVGVLAALVALCAAFALLAPAFASAQNASVIAGNAAILAIVAAAQATVLLTRNLDVSVGSIMGLAAFLSAHYAARHAGAGPEVVVFACVIGIALGGLNGVIVAYGGVSPLIATLGTMSIYRGLIYVYARGQEITSNQLPVWMLRGIDLRVGGVPVIVAISAAMVLVVAVFLHAFPLGRRIYAVGSNEAASIFNGLRVRRIVVFAYALSGLMCGFAGLLYAARVGTVTVVLATGWELTSLAAAVIGGVSVAGGSGTVIGAAIGAVVLAAIDNGLVLLGVPEFWRMFIQGSAIVLAVAVDVGIRARIAAALKRRRHGGVLA